MENLLPPEITTDILSRLPIESVQQCKLVCKTWRTLISNLDFAHLHLRRSLQLREDDDQNYQSHSGSLAASSQVGYILKVFKDERSSSYEYDLEFLYYYSSEIKIVACFMKVSAQLYYGEYNENAYESCKKLRMINHPPLKGNHCLLGSCNGLICLSVYNFKFRFYDPVYIYNPITREYVNLPRLEIIDNDNKLRSVKTTMGFGYHPSTNEYKVVRIWYPSYQPSIGHIEVYTLGGGNTGSSEGGRPKWRTKGEITYLRPKYPRLSVLGIFVNGALHWLDEEILKIETFDLADEEFYPLPSPPCFIIGESNSFNLQALGGCLCFFHKKINEFFDIWTLKKTNINCYQCNSTRHDYQSFSWSKEVSIAWDDLFNFVTFEPIAFTRTGDYVFLRHCTNLVSCDPKTSAFEKLTDHGVIPCFNAITHTNSFVSLRSLGEEDAKIIGSVEVDEPESE